MTGIEQKLTGVGRTLGKKFMARVYGLMALALFISFATAIATAYAISTYESFRQIIFGGGIWVLFVAEIILVFVLSLKIQKMSAGSASFFFLIYSVVNGATLFSIFYAYNISTIISTFLITSLMFAVMAIYGAKTKTNLLSFGRYFSMALIGILIASLIQFLLYRFTNFNVTKLDYIISLVSVLIFTLLTAYDTQKLMRVAVYDNNTEVFQKAAIIGALELYLDFINIFLNLLRIFGRSRD